MEFTLNPDNTYTLTKYTGTDTIVTIASSFSDKTVTALGDGVFANRAITSILLPNTIESIGNYAFYQCNEISSIVLPKSVQFVGKKAFYNCDKLVSITLPSNAFVTSDAFLPSKNVTVNIN